MCVHAFMCAYLLNELHAARYMRSIRRGVYEWIWFLHFVPFIDGVYRIHTHTHIDESLSHTCPTYEHTCIMHQTINSFDSFHTSQHLEIPIHTTQSKFGQKSRTFSTFWIFCNDPPLNTPLKTIVMRVILCSCNYCCCWWWWWRCRGFLFMIRIFCARLQQTFLLL